MAEALTASRRRPRARRRSAADGDPASADRTVVGGEACAGGRCKRCLAAARLASGALDTRLSIQIAGVHTEIASLESRLIRWNGRHRDRDRRADFRYLAFPRLAGAPRSSARRCPAPSRPRSLPGSPQRRTDPRPANAPARGSSPSTDRRRPRPPAGAVVRGRGPRRLPHHLPSTAPAWAGTRVPPGRLRAQPPRRRDPPPVARTAARTHGSST